MLKYIPARLDLTVCPLQDNKQSAQIRWRHGNNSVLAGALKQILQIQFSSFWFGMDKNDDSISFKQFYILYHRD